MEVAAQSTSKALQGLNIVRTITDEATGSPVAHISVLGNNKFVVIMTPACECGNHNECGGREENGIYAIDDEALYEMALLVFNGGLLCPCECHSRSTSSKSED